MNRNCPRCSQSVSEFSGLCQVCGYELEKSGSIEEGLIPCVIKFILRADKYIFITVRKFEDNGISGLFVDSLNEVYAFKHHEHPNLKQGQHIFLNMKDFDHFETGGRMKVRYFKKEINISDVADLKNYVD